MTGGDERRKDRTADARRVAVGLAAPVLAIVIAMLITIGILVLVRRARVSGFLTTIFSVPATAQPGQHHQQRPRCSTSPRSPRRSASG